jgi:hypothetical protein
LGNSVMQCSLLTGGKGRGGYFLGVNSLDLSGNSWISRHSVENSLGISSI